MKLVMVRKSFTEKVAFIWVYTDEAEKWGRTT